MDRVSEHPSQQQAIVDTADETLDIDPRSFHIFEFQGDHLLFDRATGTTSRLNDLAFETLLSIRNGIPLDDVLNAFAAKYDGVEIEGLRLALRDLKKRGFFRFVSSRPATDDELEYLWTHKPRRIQLLMAEGCNLGCRYCYQWRNGTNQRHTLMPWNVARTAVDYLVWRSGGRNDLQVTFFGGEPLLNYPMIQRVVNYCKALEKSTDKRFVFELITNGTLLSKDVVDFLVEHRFLLFISLDGWREMHEYNRPSIDRQSSHETIVKNALYANEQYEKLGLPPIKIRANLTNRYHDSKKVEEYFASLGFKLMGIGAIEPLPHGDPSPSALTEEQMDELEGQSIHNMLSLLDGLRNGKRPRAFQMRKFNSSRTPLRKIATLGVTCGVCRNTTVVDNRGNMYPCHRYAEMNDYVIGNVFTGLDRKLVLDYYHRINTHSTTECHDCWIRDYCGGGCAWLLSDKDGTIHHPTVQECARRRRSMERTLWLRQQLRENFPKWIQDAENGSLDDWEWEFEHQTTESDPASNESNTCGRTNDNSAMREGAAGNGCSGCGDKTSGSCACNSEAGAGLVQLVPLNRILRTDQSNVDRHA